jgi:methionyl-tRNA synthetase
LLGIPASDRTFDRLGSAEKRLAAGTTLPAPAPVFPRYIEPDAAKA